MRPSFFVHLGLVAMSAAACSGQTGNDPAGTTGAWTATGAGGASSSSTAAGGASGAGGSTSSSGGGGASTTTGTGTGGAPSGDPCSGAPDGAHCGADLGGLADHTSVYTCSGGTTVSTAGCPNGCANGACIQPPADPCASASYGNGAYCGGSLSGGDPNALYDCQNGVTASKTVCPAGCQVMPPMVADACKSVGDPCANASSGNGLYCGSSLGAGDANTLYDCQNGATASATVCPNGCQQNPPAVPDACKVAPGSCCLQHPSGVVTQPFTACGNGGSHYGIDYGTPVGTPIYAGMAGTVVGSALGYPNCYNNGCTASCWNSFNYVKVKADCGDPDVPGNDFYIYYLHIDSLAAGIGNGVHVDQGQLVAYSGNSGCSSGPHIHLETVSVPGGGSAVLNTCSSVDPSTRFCP